MGLRQELPHPRSCLLLDELPPTPREEFFPSFLWVLRFRGPNELNEALPGLARRGDRAQRLQEEPEAREVLPSRSQRNASEHQIKLNFSPGAREAREQGKDGGAGMSGDRSPGTFPTPVFKARGKKTGSGLFKCRRNKRGPVGKLKGYTLCLS